MKDAELTDSYNMIKKDMQSRHPERRTSSSQHLLAAAEASAITAMLTNPIWVVKTRVFGTAKSDAAAYRGLWGERHDLDQTIAIEAKRGTGELTL
jgi:solute carrier family 25 folate transporter 32